MEFSILNYVYETMNHCVYLALKLDFYTSREPVLCHGVCAMSGSKTSAFTFFSSHDQRWVR